jgi:hypothetical protein
MRQRVTTARLNLFMKSLGAAVRSRASVYLVGGATAVAIGWRDSTLDIDLKTIPDDDVLKSLSALKEELNINVELAAPDDFIPPLPNWQGRSPFIGRENLIDFFNYDFYSQALAKIERGHQIDLVDVDQMTRLKLIEPQRLIEFFEAIEDQLYKYPAISREKFRLSVETAVADLLDKSLRLGGK